MTTQDNLVEITMDGPVMENMTRVEIKWNGGDESFYVDYDDAEEFDEPALKIELIMELAATGSRNAINTANAITLNGDSVDMNAVADMLASIKALKR